MRFLCSGWYDQTARLRGRYGSSHNCCRVVGSRLITSSAGLAERARSPAALGGGGPPVSASGDEGTVGVVFFPLFFCHLTHYTATDSR